MTIALGILADDGIVVAADTKVTTGGDLTTETCKVRFCGRALTDPDSSLPIGTVDLLVTGAGRLHYLKHLMEELAKSHSGHTTVMTFDELKADLETRIDEFHTKHVVPFSGYGEERPSVSLLVGVQSGTQMKLWTTEENVVNEPGAYASVGIGSDYANILIDRFYAPMKLNGAILLASYVMFQVKEHVEGCGKRTDLYFLASNSNDGGRVSQAHMNQLEDLFRDYHDVQPKLLHLIFGNDIGWGKVTSRQISSETESIRRRINRLLHGIRATKSAMLHK